MRHAILITLGLLLVRVPPAHADALGCSAAPQPPAPDSALQLERTAHGETLAGALVVPGSLALAGASVGILFGGRYGLLGPHSARDDAALTFSILTAGASLTALVYGFELLKQGACDRRRARRLSIDGTATDAALLRVRF